MIDLSSEKLMVRGTPVRTLIGCTLGFFFGFAGVALFGITVGAFKHSMGLTPFLVGLLVAIPNLTGSLLRIPFGAWVDSNGARKPFLILFALTATGLALLFGITAYYHDGGLTRAQYPLLLLAGMFSGCGIATFSVGVGQVSYWFTQERQGTALGTYAGLGNLAPGLFSWILPLAMLSLGLTWTYGAWFGIVLIGALLYYLLAEPAPFFQLRRQGLTKEEALQRACDYGQRIFPAWRTWQGIVKAAKVWKTWALVGIYFVTFGGFLALTGWFPTYWHESRQMSISTAGLLAGTFSILASLFRVSGGRISDRLGGEKTLIGALSVILCGALILIFSGRITPALAGTVLLALGMGVGNAAVFKLVPQAVADAVGGAAGWVGGVGAFGGFVIPPALGAIVSRQGQAGYANGFWIFVILSLVGLSLALILAGSRTAEARNETPHKAPVDLQTAAVISGTVSVLAFCILFNPAAFHIIDNQQGYSPVQPVNYSHKLHAGDNQIPCLYCHFAAEKSAAAGIPPANVCMNCHTQIKTDSPEVQKIVTAIHDSRPVAWVRIHHLPDFVRFNHSAHVDAGVLCQTCHGPVETMERVSQFSSLEMGWCVNCHRQYNRNSPPELKVQPVAASTDCSACHY